MSDCDMQNELENNDLDQEKVLKRLARAARIKEERKRLNLSQADLSVSQRSQSFYENGRTDPSMEYLEEFCEAGADPHFLLKGYRAETLYDLSRDEIFILESYKRLDARGKGAVIGVLSGLDKPCDMIGFARSGGGNVFNVVVGSGNSFS